MRRPDFVCECGELAEPSEDGIAPPVQHCNGKPAYVGVCYDPECDAGPIIVPVEVEND